MPRYIMKFVDSANNKDYYMEWSSIVDAPVTWGMGRSEFLDYYRREYGEEGVRHLPERMERVEATLTSCIPFTFSDVISGNRAGPEEAELTEAEILQRYCLTQQGSNP